MKYREILIEQLKNQPYFSKKAVYQLSQQYGLKKTTVDSYISRSLRCKELVPLKNGLYVTTDFFEKNKTDISYTFYLANVLRAPAYVSSWTALQYHNLVTEAVHVITSVTLKVTRSHKTRAGNFAYQSMQKGLFTDFSLEKGKFDFFIASPAKALFDLLYFKTNQFRSVKFEDVRALVEELRIDLDDMDNKEQEKFFNMVKKYMHYE